MRKHAFILLLLFLFGCNNDLPVSPSEFLTGVPVLDIRTDAESLSRLRANKVLNVEIPVKLYYGNDSFIGEIRSAGSGSKYHPRWGFKVEVRNGQIEGLSEFNLSSAVYDRTGMNTLLAVKLYEAVGLKAHFARPVFVRINNSDEGLYPLIERIDHDFFIKRELPVYEVYKLSFETEFTLKNGFIPEYVLDKEIPDDENYSSFSDLLIALDLAADDSTKYNNLSHHLDIEKYLRYHALTSLLNNYDAFTNNFLFYKATPASPFEVIPWDFDKCFSEETNVGAYGDNEIIRTLFGNKNFRGTYKSIVKEIADNYFNKKFLFPIIDSYAEQIRDAYNLDPFLGKEGRYNFDNEIDRLKNFISNRYAEIETELNDL